MVLDGGGDDPVAGATLAQGPAGALEGEVVGFGAAPGEDDLRGAGAEGGGHRLPGLLDGRLGHPGLGVLPGGVPEGTLEEGQHGLEGLRAQRRRRSVVEVGHA